jgi:hypothetical protein
MIQITLFITCLFTFTSAFITNIAHSYRSVKMEKVLQAVINEKDMEGISGLKGYYRRPSRAIEKGGGFFVPGLENEKIRIFSATCLIVSNYMYTMYIQDTYMTLGSSYCRQLIFLIVSEFRPHHYLKSLVK